jgi:hypothetical protein
MRTLSITMEGPMAQQNTGAGTPEAVAYVLMLDIMSSEQKVFANPGKGETVADRSYVLDLYAECLSATQHRRHIPPGEASDETGVLGRRLA